MRRILAVMAALPVASGLFLLGAQAVTGSSPTGPMNVAAHDYNCIVQTNLWDAHDYN